MNIIKHIKQLIGKLTARPKHEIAESAEAELQNALFTAVIGAKSEEIGRLVALGADIDLAPQGKKNSPLYEAVTSGNIAVVKALLSKAGINHLSHGMAALHIAAGRRNLRLVEALLAMGADVNIQTDSAPFYREGIEGGQTPLHFAIIGDPAVQANESDSHFGMLNCVKVLLERNANPLISDENNKLVLDLAPNATVVDLILNTYPDASRNDVVVVHNNNPWITFFIGRLQAAGLSVVESNAKCLAESRFLNHVVKHSRFMILEEGCANQGGLVDITSNIRKSGKLVLVLSDEATRNLLTSDAMEQTWRLLTDFCGLNSDYSDVLFGLKSKTKTHDVFISYKSEDAAKARYMAEMLMNAGLKVWMAEYSILLVGRKSFQEKINRGIAFSRKAIFLTNSKYAESLYCRIEVLLALELIGNQRDVVEVMIPNESHALRLMFDSLGVHHVIWDINDETSRWREVCDKLNIKANNPWMALHTEIPASRVVVPYRNISIEVESEGWTVEPLYSNSPGTPSASALTISLRDNGSTLIRGELQLLLKEHYVDSKSESESAGTVVSRTDWANDRSRFQHQIKDFRRYLRWSHRLNGCLGIHLYFKNGEGFPSFTASAKPSRLSSERLESALLYSGNSVVRQYHFIQKHPVNGYDILLMLMFETTNVIPHDDQMKIMLQHGWQMDRMAESLRIVASAPASFSRVSMPETDVAERIVGRALAVMSFVQRAYDEQQFRKVTDKREKQAIARRCAVVRQWMVFEGFERFLAPSDYAMLQSDVGTFSQEDMVMAINLQSMAPVLLWKVGLYERPVPTIHPDNTIWTKIGFGQNGCFNTLVENARQNIRHLRPSLHELESFAMQCLLYSSRLRAWRMSAAPLRNQAVNDAAVFHVKIPSDANGDYMLPLSGQSIPDSPKQYVWQAGVWVERQLRACDWLGIKSPGRDLRSQFGEDNLTRLTRVDFDCKLEDSVWS